MLKNAKEMRKEYLGCVHDTACELINALVFLEENDLWATEMSNDNTIDILSQVFGVDEAPCELEDVYNCMNDIVDERISTDKSVVEALEEIFDIYYSDNDRCDFYLKLRGYSDGIVVD